MEIEIFVVSLAILLAVLFTWSFNTLTKEKWQIIGTVPVEKNAQGNWNGINFTFYGFFNAFAITLAVTIFVLLLGAIDVPQIITVIFFIVLLAICLPAARVMAYFVEKKRFTFSVGGSSFVGMILTPLLVVSMRSLFDAWTTSGFQVITVLAALAVAYAFGEGVGRLACISFGCCYGKPLADVHPLLQKIFKHCNFVFDGSTRKIVYADGFAGVKVVPVQAITAILFCGVGLVSMYLFFISHFSTAFVLSMAVTQTWRFASEFLRADYRGESKITKYQLMAAMMVVYSAVIALLFPATSGVIMPGIAAGLKGLWQPFMIVLLQALWVVVFVYTGKSQVTGSQISFHVNRGNI
jgi:hypothetical protein